MKHQKQRKGGGIFVHLFVYLFKANSIKPTKSDSLRKRRMFIGLAIWGKYNKIKKMPKLNLLKNNPL